MSTSAVILTGGNGSRLRPTTELYNKHAVHVYDRPMIHYPVRSLAAMGCNDVTIVVSPKGAGDVAQAVKDGSDFGVNVNYRVQKEPLGVGDAIKKAQPDVSRCSSFVLMLGDCYYDPAPPLRHEPTLFWHDYGWANQHSVYNPEANVIIEKPKGIDLGRRAVISYVYDNQVFDFIDQMEATPATGELEIVDIHNFYLHNGANLEEFTGYFSDMGTPDGLLRAANREQQRQAGLSQSQ